MTTSSQSSDNTILALVPPQIPSGTIPVEGAIYGVSLRIYDLDPVGLQVRVLSYLGQQKNDTIWLNLNGQLRIVSGQTQSDSDDVTIYLPKQLLLHNRVNELTYTVNRNSENLATSTPVLTLLYNEIRPGNEDLTPGDRQHSELELMLPDALKNGVGPDFVSATVCVRYPYCRAYDQIRLNCNGYDVFYTVTANDAPGPPNPGSSTPTTVCFTVTREDLERAQDHPQFSFSFTVTDQLFNTADPESLFSAVQTVDVDLAGKRLAKAILLENLDDYPGDDSSLIELDKLGKRSLSVYVKTDDNRIEVGDRIEAVYTATSNGQPDIVVMVSGKVEGKLGQKLPCVLEVANAKVISGYSVAVAYKVFRGATLIGESRVAYAKVVGEKTIDIAAPKLVAPATNPVEPLRYSSGVLVQVTFELALPGDKAQLFLLNPLPGSLVFPVLSLDQTFAIFTLDAVFLGQWHGKAPQLGWKLIREGKVLAESSALVLTVLPIFSGDERLPIPTLAGKAGSDLDVLQLTTKDLFELKQWPLQALGQVVWLRYDGFLDNGAGTSAELVIWGGLPHNYPPSDLATPLTAALIAWLKTLKVGSKITVTFEVNFDKVRNAVTKVTFPLRVYTVRALLMTPPAPKIKEASSNILDPIAAKDLLTVVVPHYPDMRSSDKIRVIWSGTVGNGSYTSEDFEVGTVGIKEIPIPNTVVVFNLGLLVTVSYIVIRDGVSTPSLTLQLTVATIKNEDDRLPIPKILQAANGGEGSELDVSKLTAGATVNCLVWPLIAFGQPVWLHLRGKNASGGEHNITLLRHPNNAVHEAWLNAGYYNSSVLYSYLKDLGNGSVLEVWFTAALDKGTDESKAVRFPVRRYSVRAALMTPPAPKIKEASSNILDPIAAKDLLTVVVPHYPDMRSSDKIRVIWSGTVGNGSYTSEDFEVGTVGIKEIPIPNTVVVFNLGLLVTVSYIVIRDGVSTPSLTLQLTVATIKNEDDRLPIPKILQAANGGEGSELDVSKLTAGATVNCLVWPLIAFGQPVWLHLRGKNASGGEHNITLLRHPNNAVHEAWLNAGYYNSSVLYSYLKDLGNGSVLEVWFTAALDKGTDESKAVRFPVRRYAVKALVDEKPKISSVKNLKGVEIEEGDVTTDTTVELTGTASLGQKVRILDGAIGMGEATADQVTGIWTREVSDLSAAVHSFTAEALYGIGQVSEPPRTFRIVPALVIDISDLTLSGENYSLLGSGLPWISTGIDLPGTYATRSVSGGLRPYTYTPSHPLLASVDSSGVVRSQGNGTSTITVADQSGLSATFKVITSGVKYFRYSSLLSIQFNAWVDSVGGEIFGSRWDGSNHIPDPRAVVITSKFTHVGPFNGVATLNITRFIPGNFTYWTTIHGGRVPQLAEDFYSGEFYPYPIHYVCLHSAPDGPS